MISSIPLLKGIVAITIAGGTGIVIYKYRQQLAEFWNANYQDFLVLASENSSEDIKNYSCTSENKEEETDTGCEIVSLNFDDKKYIDANTVNSSNKLFTEKLQANSFYKLSINVTKFQSGIKNNETIISLKSKDSSKSSHLSKLKIISSINKWNSSNEKLTLNKVLVKAKSSVLGRNLTKIDCKIKTVDKKVNCSIYKFENKPINKNVFDFSKVKKITKLNEIQADQYYWIDFSTEITNKDKLIKNNIDGMTIEHDSNHKTSLSFVSEIFTNFTNPETNSANNIAVISSDNFVPQTLNKTYLIGQTETVTPHRSSSFAADQYKCKISNIIDNNCTIVELKNDEKTFAQINSSIGEVNAANLKTEKKYYKIFANNEIINQITKWDATEKVEIVKSTNNNQKFGSLKIISLVEGGVLKNGKTNLVIVKAKSIENVSRITGHTYDCKIANFEKKSCDIYKFVEQPSEKNIISSVSETLNKVSNVNEWKRNHFYLIDLKNANQFDLSTLKNLNQTKITISSSTTSVGSFAITTPLANFSSFASADFSKLIALA